MPEMLVRCLPGCHLAMLSAQTHKAPDTPTGLLGASVLALPTDPSTFGGGVAVAVIGALIATLIVGVIGVLRRRRRTAESSRIESQSSATAAESEYVADLVTGIGQAVMGVREAIELFGKDVLLEDPETGELEENSREVLVEAHRRVQEAEARLPRVQLLLGERVAEARRAIEELRSALKHLSDYIRQPGWGEDWSYTELEVAKESLKRAREHEQRFLERARG
jgi:hypothetical protein